MVLTDTASKAFTSAQEQDPPRSDRDLDWAIVKRVQAGDIDAFDQLVKKYRKPIFFVVYNMINNSEDATDLTQEIFIKAFQAIACFKGKASFFTWIHRIAINATMTFMKKQSRRRCISYEAITEGHSSLQPIEPLTAENRSENGALVHELQEKLNDSLQKLSTKHRIVVVLHEIEGLSHPEIAEIIKTSEGTVRSRLHYAKKQLQSHLKDYLADKTDTKDW